MYKVLYICPSSGIGGAETFLKQTFQKVDSNKFQNHYLLFRTGPLFDFLQENGARVHLLKQPPKLSQINDHKLVHEELRNIINENSINLVHSTMAYGALFAARTCKQMNIPHVWFQHGPASGWMDRIASVLPHNGLIVNSHYTSKKQRELENPVRFLIPREIPIEKLLLGTSITPPSLEEAQDYKAQLLTQYSLAKETIVISMLCRLQTWKGVHVLIEALTLLKKETLDKPYYCFIWGDAFKGTEYRDELKRMIDEQALPAKLMGTSPSVPLSLGATDIIVNASTQPEPFGLSIIEGMMTGAVPIVPNEGGPLEIVSNGKDGLIFQARQAGSLAKNIKTLLADSELRLKLSTEAKTTAENKFNANRAISQLETFYQKVLQ